MKEGVKTAGGRQRSLSRLLSQASQPLPLCQVSEPVLVLIHFAGTIFFVDGAASEYRKDIYDILKEGQAWPSCLPCVMDLLSNS